MKHSACLAGALWLVASAAGSAPATPPGRPTWTEASSGMEFVSIPKGCVQIGSRQAVQPQADTMWQEVGYAGTPSDNEKPRHEVCVDAFWMGRKEVSVKEWQAVMGPLAGVPREELPMASVSWEQARRYAQLLSERSGGRHRYRLPTEAEWEYACRAGVADDARPASAELARTARYGLGNPTGFEGQPAPGPVGRLEPNAFGLYDMLGNVWEWVADSYAVDGYARHALHNPRVDGDGAERVIRGGSYRTEFAQVRCSRRGHQPAAEALGTIGFRLVRER